MFVVFVGVGGIWMEYIQCFGGSVAYVDAGHFGFILTPADYCVTHTTGGIVSYTIETLHAEATCVDTSV